MESNICDAKISRVTLNCGNTEFIQNFKIELCWRIFAEMERLADESKEEAADGMLMLDGGGGA